MKISDASTVVEEAISKGTARRDPEEGNDQETDIEMTEEGDREVETGHPADPPETTQDPWTEEEATEITVTAEDMVAGMTTEEMTIVMTEEAEVDAIEEGITLATGTIDPTTETDLGPELLLLETVDAPTKVVKGLTDPTTGEIDLSKKAATLRFKTRNCLIMTNNLRTTKTSVVNSSWSQRFPSKMGKSSRKQLKLQLKSNRKLILSNPQLTRPKTSEIMEISKSL